MTVGAVMNEGAVSTRLGLKGWPNAAEDIIVSRNVILATYTGALTAWLEEIRALLTDRPRRPGPSRSGSPGRKPRSSRRTTSTRSWA